MKLKYTCFLYLLLISTFSFSQDPEKRSTASIPSRSGTSGTSTSIPLASNSALTGVWRGFFTSGSGFFKEKYKYEVQIGQLTNNGIKGVTYSYKTTVFYGKASLAGMYTASTKNLILKETKLLEVKMTGGAACLMTCYLEYSKLGNTEILEGTFTSVNTESNTDCGSGRVYLEKVPESDFYKEDFVKEYETKKKNPPVATVITPKTTTPKTTVTLGKDAVKIKPKPKGTVVNKTPKKTDKIVKIDPPADIPTPNSSEKTTGKITVTPSSEEPKKPISKELKERERTVAKVIEAEGDEIQIELYDNGQIDDDTVTVYHNNQVIAWKKRLCHQPITFKIKVDPKHPKNEFAMVADNLGTIPPNTALMVITIGKQRYDVFLTSNFQKNAVVIVNCKMPSEDSK